MKTFIVSFMAERQGGKLQVLIVKVFGLNPSGVEAESIVAFADVIFILENTVQNQT